MASISWLALLATLVSATVKPGISQVALTMHSDMRPVLPLQNISDVRPLSPEEVAKFKPYSWYASTVGCQIDDIKTWTCGKKCDANPYFEHVITGHYGPGTQFWFSGYDRKREEVIVSHQGTNGSEWGAVLTLLDFRPVSLNPSLFPDIDESIWVHEGVATSHNRSALDVLVAVKEILSVYQAKKVTVVGPSLGAAIALLDAIFLPLHLPKDVTVHYIGYSSLRVGNQAFADYVDAQNISITRINNKQDPVPDLPPMVFGYHHPSGEIHIRNNDSQWVACPGQDNPDEQCSTGAVTLATAHVSDHNGPFDGVNMGECPKDLAKAGL